MKSAYELALERLERQGIERPREEAVSDETRRRLSEVRQQTEAKLAELEILHRDRLRGLYDPEKRREEEEEYVRERRRLEADRDRSSRSCAAPPPRAERCRALKTVPGAAAQAEGSRKTSPKRCTARLLPQT